MNDDLTEIEMRCAGRYKTSQRLEVNQVATLIDSSIVVPVNFIPVTVLDENREGIVIVSNVDDTVILSKVEGALVIYN